MKSRLSKVQLALKLWNHASWTALILEGYLKPNTEKRKLAVNRLV